MRYAISGVIARLPLTMSDTADCGLPMAFASRYCEMPSGSRNSSLSISPGVEIYVSVVVNKLNPFDAVFGPKEAKPPLLIHTDTVASGAVSAQSLKMVTWRNAQVVQ